MVRDFIGKGGIELEIWAVPLAAAGSFLTEVASPLGIGTITLDDGGQVKGFVCETYAVAHARDITNFGGWRAYLAASVAETKSRLGT